MAIVHVFRAGLLLSTNVQVMSIDDDARPLELWYISRLSSPNAFQVVPSALLQTQVVIYRCVPWIEKNVSCSSRKTQEKRAFFLHGWEKGAGDKSYRVGRFLWKLGS